MPDVATIKSLLLFAVGVAKQLAKFTKSQADDNAAVWLETFVNSGQFENLYLFLGTFLKMSGHSAAASSEAKVADFHATAQQALAKLAQDGE